MMDFLMNLAAWVGYGLAAILLVVIVLVVGAAGYWFITGKNPF